jgi:glycosyltransferase involved in cell wall biosynthesis
MKNVVIANFYHVWPPIGGGQRRIFFLARELSKDFDVDIVVPERQGINKILEFSPTLRQIHVAVESRFRTFEQRLENEVRMAADVAYAMHWDECHLYQQVLADRVSSADAVVTAHPYSIRAILKARGDRSIPVVFDSQNVECRGKASVLDGFDSYLDEVRAIERSALENADCVIACSDSDSLAFAEDYGVEADRFTIIENGVDAIGVPVVSLDIRDKLRAELGLSDKLAAVFGGSYHHPNFRAAQRIVDIAPSLPQITFLFLGRVCNHDALQHASAANIICLGEVDESTKWMTFNVADIGLNPMELGSGTNIKMFEYAAAGLTAISTRFGARGIELEPGLDFLLAEVEEMPSLLGSLDFSSHDRLRKIGALAQKKVIAVADWSVIGKRYREKFCALTD